jgi:serine/threonine protein kinase
MVVIRSGFLNKKGNKIRTYRKKYFELHDTKLYYFDHSPSENETRKPRNYFNIEQAIVGNYISNRKKRFVIQVKEHKGVTVKLEAETEKDWSDWTLELKRIAQPTLYAAEKLATRAEKISIDSFELERGIGRGYFATVLRVQDLFNQQYYALKIINKEAFPPECEIKRSHLCDLDHPFIVKLQHAFQTKDKLYLVMDLLIGGELMFHLKNGEVFNEKRARFYAAEILLALEYLHGKDIIYRDLRSENVMIDKEGHICLTEFGLGRTIETEYWYVGTPEYFSPQVLRGEGHDKSIDLWSFGVLLYEMLVGIPPYLADTPELMLELIKMEPIQFPSNVRKDAKSLICSLLRDDDSRIQDVASVKKHAFFESIDWDKMLKRKIRPPWLPDNVNKYLEKLEWDLVGNAGDKSKELDDVPAFEYNLYQ